MKKLFKCLKQRNSVRYGTLYYFFMSQRTIYKQQITTTLAGVRDFIIALRLVRERPKLLG